MRARRGLPAAAFLLVVTAGCFGGGEPVDPHTALGVEAGMETWDEGQSLFYRQHDWIGGDGAYSRDLGNGKVLWLFGDSLVKTDRTDEEERVWFIHNSAAIQTGYDVREASIQFHWGEDEPDKEGSPADELLSDLLQEESEPEPRSLIPDPGEDRWFWPADAVLVNSELIIFASEVKRVEGEDGFGFEGVRWTAFHVQGPLLDPSRWTFRELDVDGRHHGVTLGSATLVHDNYLYVYGHRSHEDQASGTLHDTMLARWPMERVASKDLRDPEWWGGPTEGWDTDANPEPIFTTMVIVGSVQYNPILELFVLVRMDGFGPADIVGQTAPAPQGPWSDPVVIYEPPEAANEEGLIYLPLMHPWSERETGENIMTYHYSGETRPRMARAR